MTVYIEYAFLQNFLLDGVLLWLSYKGTKTPFKWGRYAFATLFGAVFAVVYPLLGLTSVLSFLLKISAGFFLCLLAFGNLRGKKEWGRYTLFSAIFFSLSFLFGGALNSITQGLSTNVIRKVVTPLGFLCLSLFCVYLFRRLYKKKAILRFIYECTVASNNKSITVLGFFDSGNAATKKGLPICFVSPEIIYELFGEEVLSTMRDRGQVCDEMCITTVSGGRKIYLYKGSLTIKKDKQRIKIKEVYFSPSANILSREYSMILHSRIFDEGEEL